LYHSMLCFTLQQNTPAVQPADLDKTLRLSRQA